MKVIIDFVRHLRGISKNVTCQINVVWLTFLLLGAIFHSIGGLKNQNVSKLIQSIISLHFCIHTLFHSCIWNTNNQIYQTTNSKISIAINIEDIKFILVIY